MLYIMNLQTLLCYVKPFIDYLGPLVDLFMVFWNGILETALCFLVV